MSSVIQLSCFCRLGRMNLSKNWKYSLLSDSIERVMALWLDIQIIINSSSKDSQAKKMRQSKLFVGKSLELEDLSELDETQQQKEILFNLIKNITQDWQNKEVVSKLQLLQQYKAEYNKVLTSPLTSLQNHLLTNSIRIVKWKMIIQLNLLENSWPKLRISKSTKLEGKQEKCSLSINWRQKGKFQIIILDIKKEMNKKQVTYAAVNQFIIAIKCCAVDEIKRLLSEYDEIIVNRLQTQTRQPALYFASIMVDHQQSYNIMKLLINYGANPHFKDSYHQTVLFYVCREGKQKCLDLLLEKGLNLEDEDIYGQTPLFYAAKENRLNIIHKLLEKKASPNHFDRIAQQTPLFYAAREGHLQMCKILIEGGCDLFIQDTAHKIAAHYAKKYGKNDVFQYLNNQLQNLKDQKKIQTDSIQESNVQERGGGKKTKKRDGSNVPAKAMYRLYRSDNLGNANEVSQAQYEQLLQNYSDFQQLVKNIEEIDLSNLQQVKMKEAWVKVAQKALTVCWKSKGGYYFHQPVDPSKYGIVDYFDVIQQPMDFGTIKKKLTFNVYNNVQEFIVDMKMVFDNCIKYNGIENQIAKHAIEIKNLFEQNMKQTGYMN